MGWMIDNIGRLIARLQKPVNHCEPLTSSYLTALCETLQPGDVLLVEGKGRVSGIIKYLTQSTWSHSALYVGPIAGAVTDGEPHVLIEANIDEGVVSAPLSKYRHCQTRICRPVDLSKADCRKVCRYASERIGLGYDFKNVIDLMRYLVPWPLTQRGHRQTIALGSGDASRLICSSLIAQAFDTVRYPILPKITHVESQTARREIAEIRHPSLCVPGDFDMSPYFMVVKPPLARLNYKDLHCADHQLDQAINTLRDTDGLGSPRSSRRLVTFPRPPSRPHSGSSPVKHRAIGGGVSGNCSTDTAIALGHRQI